MQHWTELIFFIRSLIKSLELRRAQSIMLENFLFFFLFSIIWKGVEIFLFFSLKKPFNNKSSTKLRSTSFTIHFCSCILYGVGGNDDNSIVKIHCVDFFSSFVSLFYRVDFNLIKINRLKMSVKRPTWWFFYYLLSKHFY